MSLYREPFENIKNGRKTIEIRLFDKKRRLVKPRDTITFSKLPEKEEKITVKVIGLSVFASFKDLLTAFDKTKFGHPANITLKKQIERQRTIYTKAEENKYGVVGIHIKLLKN